jgi:hypothetical protein
MNADGTEPSINKLKAGAPGGKETGTSGLKEMPPTSSR